MVVKGFLRHLSIEVTDVPRARSFYDRLLPRLGFRRFVAEAEYLGYTDGTMTLWLVRNAAPRIHRRPPTGDEEVIAEHLAFHLPSASALRAIASELAEQELYPFFPPEEHPEFRPGYFSATWLDPEGVAVELYAIGERSKRRARPTAHRARRHAGRPARAGRRRRASG